MLKTRTFRRITTVIFALMVIFGTFGWSIPYKIHYQYQILAIQAIPLKVIVDIHVAERRWLWIGGKRIREPRSQFPFFTEVKATDLVAYGKRLPDETSVIGVFDRRTKKWTEFPVGTSALGLAINAGDIRDDVWATNSTQ